MEAHPSDSAAQELVERAIIQRLSAAHPEWQPLKWDVVAKALGLSPVWQGVKPDAIWRTENDELIIAECYARVGVLKSGHKRKLAMDALKLMALCRQLADAKRLKCLIVIPQELEKQLKREGWFCAALTMAGDVLPVDLLDDERKLLADTTQRQAEGQTRSRKREQMG